MGGVTAASVPSDHRYTPSSSLIDPLGRTIKTTDRNGTEEVIMQYVYNIQGNLLEVKDPYDRSVFLHEYDFANRPLKTTHLDGGTKYVVMDCMSKPIEMRDEKGALVLNAYDDLNRPTRIWARDNGDADVTLRQKMIYGDSADILNPENSNLKGKLYKQYDEAGLTTIEAYDFKGQVPEKIREVIKNEELLSVFDTPPVDWKVDAYRVNWSEDEEENDDLLDEKAYVTSMEYDALGRVTKMIYPEDVETERKELTTTYNRSGALESVSMDGDLYVDRIAYNARGQKILTAFGNGIMTRYEYREDNFRLLRMKSEGYEKILDGTNVTYEKQSGTTRQNFTYVYDLSGNIISITDTTTGCGVGGSNELVREFEYDALYRLLSAKGRETASTATTPWRDRYRPQNNYASRAYTQHYDYDKLGNILTLQHVASGGNFTRIFNPDGSGDPVEDYGSQNLLNKIKIGANEYEFGYDVNGNMISEGTNRHFAYDYADRLKAFYIQATDEEPSTHTQYFYDAGGNRVKKISRVQGGTSTKTTVYIDGIFEHTISATADVIPDLEIGPWCIGYGSGEQNTLHIMDGSSRIATRRLGDAMDDTTPSVKYNLEDHLGSSNLLLSTDGALVSKEEYYPFGETSFGSYGKKRYRFCGKEKDEESGLYYYGLRYYNPWTCRFINLDPLAAKYPFYTPYQYAGNKPINFIDLDGAEPAPPKTNATQTFNFSGVVGQKLGVVPDAVNDNIGRASPTNANVSNSTPNPVKEIVQATLNAGNRTLNGGTKRIEQYGEVASKVADKITNTPDTIQEIGAAARKYAEDSTVGSLLKDAANAYWTFSPTNVLIETTKSNFAPLVSLAQGDFESLGSQYVDHLAKGGVAAATVGVSSVIAPEAAAVAETIAAEEAMASRTAIQGAVDPALSSAGWSAPIQAAPTGQYYSVAFEMELSSSLYPNKGPYSHFKAANTALDNAMAADEGFSNSMNQLGIAVPKTPAGTVTGGKIPNYVWHHSSETGIMQLVPQGQHTTGSIFWNTLHPEGKGGMSIWGGGYKR